MKKNTAMIIMIVVILLLLAAVGFLVIKYVVNGNNNNNTPVDQLDIDIDQGEYQENAQIIHSNNILLPGWGELTIAKGTTDVEVDFYNPKGNVWYVCHDCGEQLDGNLKCMNEKCGHTFKADDADVDCYYMSFTLCLENGEKLYESGLVAPGKHIQHITLSRAMTEGDYDAYIMIQPYKSDRATACNNGKVEIQLHVK